LDEGCSIAINSNADPDLAPKDKASVTIITGANYRDFPERGTKEYLDKKREFAEFLIKKAEKIIPNLSKHIIVKDAATHKNIREIYLYARRGDLFYRAIN